MTNLSGTPERRAIDRPAPSTWNTLDIIQREGAEQAGALALFALAGVYELGNGSLVSLREGSAVWLGVIGDLRLFVHGVRPDHRDQLGGAIALASVLIMDAPRARRIVAMP